MNQNIFIGREPSSFLSTAIRTSISDDWSSTGFMEAAAELETSSTIDKEKMREKREKERQKERAKVGKEKEDVKDQEPVTYKLLTMATTPYV